MTTKTIKRPPPEESMRRWADAINKEAPNIQILGRARQQKRVF